MATVNSLAIGPMGFGGKVTLIGCKVGALNRLPAMKTCTWLCANQKTWLAAITPP